MQTRLDDRILSDLNRQFDASPPEEIVRWALSEPSLKRVAIASAFQVEGTCLIHMAVQARPNVPILFLETGFHFAETLAFKERLTEQLGLNVVDLTGDYTVERQTQEFGARLYERDPKRCCELNKVLPFARGLRDYDAWMTSMRRDSAWTRKRTSIVSQTELEPDRSLVKINPMANWKRRDAWAYLKEYDLPHSPLYDLGYASIGCAPCTRMVFPGEDERAGRWSGLLKTECGIHVREASLQDDDSECDDPSELAAVGEGEAPLADPV